MAGKLRPVKGSKNKQTELIVSEPEEAKPVETEPGIKANEAANLFASRTEWRLRFKEALKSHIAVQQQKVDDIERREAEEIQSLRNRLAAEKQSALEALDALRDAADEPKPQPIRRTESAVPRATSADSAEAKRKLLAVIRSAGRDGLGKGAILAEVPMTDGRYNAAVKSLVAEDAIVMQGDRRSARWIAK
jgi:hypothetical protein